MTAGDLRNALADIADDTKLIFSTAEEPGSDLAGPEQIAFSAGMSTFFNSYSHETYPAFEVSLEFPPGTYHRHAWKDDELTPEVQLQSHQRGPAGRTRQA